jgi:chromosome partitioning protein
VDLEFFRRLTEPLGTKAARARARTQLEAAMACAALVAAAEDKPGLAQRLMLDQILDGVESLRGGDPHIAVGLFEDFLGAIRDNPADGRGRALSAIAVFAGTPDTARMLMQITRAMAGAQPQTGGRVRAEIASIARALALPCEGPAIAPKTESTAPGSKPGVIVLGNEKGGTGKSTTAMHLAVALLRRGHKVGTIDLDGHQGTLSRYIANRDRSVQGNFADLPMPEHHRIAPSTLRDRDAARTEERGRVADALSALAGCRYVLIDTPGSHSNLSRLGVELADWLITPLNDSFLDLDVLAEVDRERREVTGPSAYGRMVLDEAARRTETGRPDLRWIVMRNRLGHLDSRNTRDMDALLRQLGARMGFSVQAGISERVVFRELFFKGLTLLDPPQGEAAGVEPPARAAMSHRHARRELEDLIAALNLPA